MCTPGSCNDPRVSSFCHREGSKTPSNVRQIRPNPSIPVVNSWMRIKEAGVCVKECNRGGSFEYRSEMLLLPRVPSRIGKGDERGAKTRCVLGEAERTTPEHESDP